MKKKEFGFMFSVVVFVALITIKLWIKQRFELQLLGLIILIGISWGLKFLVFRKVKGNKKRASETDEDKTETAPTLEKPEDKTEEGSKQLPADSNNTPQTPTS